MDAPSLWLVVATGGALLGSIVTLVTTLADRARAAFIAAATGMAVACISSAVVAFQMSGDHDALVHVFAGNWISFAIPRAPAIAFGLEATFYKSAFVAVVALIFLVALWATTAGGSETGTENQILSISLLFAGATVFVFAPTLFQALIGWCVVSLLTGVLIRLARGTRSSQSGQPVPIEEPRVGLVDQLFLTIARAAEFGERLFVARVWKLAMSRLPFWVAEQADHLQHETISLQLIAMSIGAFAIVLTWLI